MAPRPALERLKDRPDPAVWKPDELISFAESVALFFPSGPMTANALRLAHARGQLGATEICGKLYTTPAALAAMMMPRLKPVPEPEAATVEPMAGPGRLPAKLRRRIAAFKRRR